MTKTNTYTSKFAIGQEVWILRKEEYMIHTLRCEHCRRDYTHNIKDYHDAKWYVHNNPQTILYVHFEKSIDGIIPVYESQEAVSIREHSTYATKEEAEEECERRNNDQSNDD